MSAQSNIQQQGNNAGNSQQQRNSKTGNQQGRRSNNNSSSNTRKVNQRGQNPHKPHNGPKGATNLADPNNLNTNNMINNNMSHPHHHNNNQAGNFNNNNNQYYSQNFQNKTNKYHNRRNVKAQNYNYAPINPFKFNQPYVKQQKAYIDLKKTKMCANFASGNCLKGDQCSFAHNEAELKQKPDLNKTKLCEEYEKNKKCNNESCSFAHGISDLRHTEDFYKTSLCFNFSKEGKCENGDKCRYAHGDAELKRRSNVDSKLSRKKYNNNGRKNKFGIMMNNQPIDQQQLNQFFMIQNFLQNMQYVNNTMN